MTVSPVLLLLVYSLAIVLASLGGGLLPERVHMTHTRMQLVMSLVAGLMLGVAFFHLLPHSVTLLGGAGSLDRAIGWLMGGLVVMLLLLRLFHFHQHDFSAEEEGHQGHAHDVQHGNLHGLSWFGFAIGLGVHTLIDGVALGAVMQDDIGSQAGGLLGIGVFLAILLHKPLDAMSITALMAAAGRGENPRRIANLVFACICPLGAMLFFFGVPLAGPAQQTVIGSALAFSAGAFICIALSDLLPEVHFHQHDRVLLTAAFLAGLALAWIIGGLEPASLHQGATGH